MMLMVPAMLAVMLYRKQEYSAKHSAHQHARSGAQFLDRRRHAPPAGGANTT